MSGFIEVKDAEPGQLFDAATPVGVYAQQGGLWIATGNGTYPVFISISGEFNALIRDSAPTPSSGTAVSETTLLKAIAVSQRPELAKELT